MSVMLSEGCGMGEVADKHSHGWGPARMVLGKLCRVTFALVPESGENSNRGMGVVGR